MLNLSPWRKWSVIIVTILGIIWAMPNALSEQARAKLPKFLPHNAINLGLDLQGGSHLLFEVDKQAIYKQRIETLSDDMVNVLRGINVEGSKDKLPAIAFSGRGISSDGMTAKVTITNSSDIKEAVRRINTLAQPITSAGTVTSNSDINVVTSGNNITVTIKDDAKVAMERSAVSQSIEVVRRRIDKNGTKEPVITRQGSDRIVVQAPGESDPEKLKSMIGQTAKLTFQMVDDTVSMQEAMAGRIPPGDVLLPQPDNPSEPYVLLKRRAVVSGENLTDARPNSDPNSGQWVVSFRMDGTGARAFARTTTENVGKRFAIVLDNKVISAPVVQEPITGGQGQITGNFTVESANDLSTLLKAGALPAPLKILEQRTVGAELGADAISSGSTAGLIALGLVVAFMILAYGFIFGGISIIALIINMILIFAAMSTIGATLTLPGIAGLVLTLGMAVDANVLIYERMREEYSTGRSVAMSMDAGYNRAIMTIVDSNVTTLLAAVILFYFGSGPVRGFAWTLSIGVFTSVFTAVLVTQFLLAYWYKFAKPKTLPIGER